MAGIAIKVSTQPRKLNTPILYSVGEPGRRSITDKMVLDRGQIVATRTAPADAAFG